MPTKLHYKQRIVARNRAKAIRVTRETKASLLKKLDACETRTWLSMGQKDKDLIDELKMPLTIAGLVHVSESGKADGGIFELIAMVLRVLDRCSKTDDLIGEHETRSISLACQYAREMLESSNELSVQKAILAINGL